VTYQDLLVRFDIERGAFVDGSLILEDAAAYGASEERIASYIERTSVLALPGDGRERAERLAARLRASTPAELADWARTLRLAAEALDAYLRRNTSIPTA
jgi:hypothetical protein